MNRGNQASHGEGSRRFLEVAEGTAIGSDLFGLTMEHCPAAVAVLDRAGCYLVTSKRWLVDLGIPEQDLTGRSHFEIWPQTSEAWRAAYQRCLSGSVEAGTVEWVREERLAHGDGSVDWVRWELRPWHSADGGVAGLVVFAEKSTEQRRAHEELQRSEERLRLAVTGARVGTWHWNLRTDELIWSDLCYEIFGLPLGTAISYEEFLALVHTDDRARVAAAVRHALTTQTEYDLVFRNTWPDGSLHWTSAKGRVTCDSLGQPLRMEGIILDVTPRQAAERALSESEERYRMLAEGMPHMLWQLDPSGALVYANHGWRRYFGRGSIELFQWGEVVHPDDLSRVFEAWPQMTVGETNIAPFRLRRHDGVYRWFTCRSVPVRDATGSLLHIIGISTDVEALVRTEEALRMSQARLDTALRAAGVGTWVWEIEADRMLLDQALTQLLGVEHAMSMAQFHALAHEDDRPALEQAVQRAARREGELEIEYRLHSRDGRTRWFAAKGRLETTSDGTPHRLFGACVDVTQHKRLEDDLRQAQKMEAIGQLAGGVAHDFNNLLTVIMGQASIAELTPGLPARAMQSIQGISDAAERAASLTAQLLAFGRRQTMNARDLRLDDLVLSVTSMLTRVLGGQISLAFEPGALQTYVHADPNMLTQVLLNLAINARDAMPRGGELVLQTRVGTVADGTMDAPTRHDGPYVCLSVRDTGHGIPPAILPHIFEPFFTTKEVGRGTGLGLSTVYGIVKQHHGFITVDSEPNKGSLFKVYLPSVRGSAAAVLPSSERPRVGTGELILFVEDEPGVRSVVQSVLEEHGYRLLVAADSNEALAYWAEHSADIDLLLSDVVMPNGLSGCELAATLQLERPQLKSILCSGYSAASVMEAMKGLKQSVFLPKPYRPDQLLLIVRRVLDKG